MFSTYQFSHVHDNCHELVDVPGLLLSEVEDLEGIVSELQVLVVIDGGHGCLALGHKVVVIDVLAQMADLKEIGCN